MALTQDERRQAVVSNGVRFARHAIGEIGLQLSELARRCEEARVELGDEPEPDWRDDVVRALRAVLPENWGVVKTEYDAAMNYEHGRARMMVHVYGPAHGRVCWFHSDWRDRVRDHAIMAVVAEYLEKHPREGV